MRRAELRRLQKRRFVRGALVVSVMCLGQ